MSEPVDVTGGAGGITANRYSIAHLATLHTTGAAALALATGRLENEASALGLGGFAGDYGNGGRLDRSGLLMAQVSLQDAVTGLRRSADQVRDLAVKLRWTAQGYPWGRNALDLALLDQVNGLLRPLTRSSMFGASATFVTGGRPEPATTVAGQDASTIDVLLDLTGVAAIAELVSGDGDGRGIAVATGTAGVAPPRGLAHLIDGLADVNRSGTPGGIAVRVLTDADGHRRAVVDITGTRVWTPGGRNPADLTTNTRALGGHNTAYSEGVVAALRQAGVRRGEPVMLVGHSQGGMVAVNTAAVLARSGEFNVTHVVTAGSPISLTVDRLPPSVRVLALENSRDVVPRVDGKPNPDRRNVTTVSGAYGDGSTGDCHSLDSSYRPLATDAERSRSRSVRDFLDGAGGYFRAVSAEQHTYRVERR